MKRLVWLLVVAAAVVISVVLGMFIGGGGNSSQRRTLGDGADAGALLPVGTGPVNAPNAPGGSGATGDATSGPGSDATNSSRRQVAVRFEADPAVPAAQAPVTLQDATDVAADDAVLASDWKIEGPGLTRPQQLTGNEVSFTFPEAGLYRVSHRVQLRSTGLSDWVTETISVAAETEAEEAPRLVPLVLTDANGAVDLWIENGKVRFRVNSAALDEPAEGAIVNLRAKVVYHSGEVSTFGPGTYLMDLAFTIGDEHSGPVEFSISGELPSGRQWEQSFRVR